MTTAQTETRKATIKIEHLPKCLRARVQGKREERERAQKNLERQRRKEKEKREAAKKKEEKEQKEAERTAERKKAREIEKMRASQNRLMRAKPKANPPNLRAALDAMTD